MKTQRIDYRRIFAISASLILFAKLAFIFVVGLLGGVVRADVGDTLEALLAGYPRECSAVADNTLVCQTGFNRSVAVYFDSYTRRVWQEVVYENGVVVPQPLKAYERLPQDCELVAQRAYAQLKPSAAWCQIIGFMLAGGGHAAVVYKHQIDGPVIYYDANGSLNLGTTSTDLAVIEAAMKRIVSADTHERFFVGLCAMQWRTR